MRIIGDMKQVGTQAFVLHNGALRLGTIIDRKKVRVLLEWKNGAGATRQRWVRVADTPESWYADANQSCIPVAALDAVARFERWQPFIGRRFKLADVRPTTQNQPCICLYGQGADGNGAGWLARWNGEGFGTGVPVPGTRYSDAIADAGRTLYAAGARGTALVFDADGERCGTIGYLGKLPGNVYETIDWQPAPKYELSTEALEAAVTPEADAVLYGDRTPLDPPADKLCSCGRSLYPRAGDRKLVCVVSGLLPGVCNLDKPGERSQATLSKSLSGEPPQSCENCGDRAYHQTGGGAMPVRFHCDVCVHLAEAAGLMEQAGMDASAVYVAMKAYADALGVARTRNRRDEAVKPRTDGSIATRRDEGAERLQRDFRRSMRVED